MFFLGLGDEIAAAFRVLMGAICEPIYRLMAALLELFMNLAGVKILESDAVNEIYKRVIVILTVVMVFYITFEFVKYIVTPDQMTDKEKGVSHIVRKMIIVVLLLAFTPTLFSISYTLQQRILQSELIPKVILGRVNSNPGSIGNEFAANVFSMFYKVTPYIATGEYTGDCDDLECEEVVNLNLDMFRRTGRMPYLELGLKESQRISTKDFDKNLKVWGIEFDYLLCLLFGLFVCFVLLMYCIDVAKRVIQFTFLQLIAPIPIIGYLSPKKEGIFQKWFQFCLTTYLDLFIRIAIIYFIVLLCNTLTEAFKLNTLFAHIDPAPSESMKTWMYIFLIAGLLMFAMKAPQMLKELLPPTNAASGEFGFKKGSRIPASVSKLAARTIGAGLGGAANLTRGAIARGRAAHARRKANGIKSVLTKEGREQRRQEKARKQEASEARKKHKRLKRAGYDTANKEYESKKGNLKEVGEKYQKAKKERETLEKLNDKSPEGQKKLEAARKKENDAKTATLTAANDFKKAQKNRDSALQRGLGKEDYQKYREERKEAAAIIGASKAVSNLEKAQSNKEASINSYNEAQNELKRSRVDYKDAKELRDSIAVERDNAQKELEIAKSSGDVEKISMAQEKFNKLDADYKEAKKIYTETNKAKKEANQNSRDAKEEKEKMEKAYVAKEENYNNLSEKLANKGFGNAFEQAKDSATLAEKQKLFSNGPELQTVESAKNEMIETQSRVAEDKNNRIGTSVVGGIAGGVVEGAYYGIKHGAKATRFGEVINKVKEGAQADIKNIEAVQKYYDAGGTKTVVGRTLNRIANSMGGPTAYSITQQTKINPLETEIRDQESYVSLESDVRTKVDSVKDRGESKLEKGEIKVLRGTFENPKSIPSGAKLDISGAETLSDVYAMYSTKADTLQSQADSAAKTYQEALSSGASQDKLNKLERDRDNAANAAYQARLAQKEIKKKSTEYVFTQILNDSNPRANSNFDPVMVGMVEDMRQSIANARSNPETCEAMRKKAIDSNDEELIVAYQQFMSGNFTNFDYLDKAQATLKQIADERARKVSELKEQKRQIETSARTQSEKADAEFNGGK